MEKDRDLRRIVHINAYQLADTLVSESDEILDMLDEDDERTLHFEDLDKGIEIDYDPVVRDIWCGVKNGLQKEADKEGYACELEGSLNGEG